MLHAAYLIFKCEPLMICAAHGRSKCDTLVIHTVCWDIQESVKSETHCSWDIQVRATSYRVPSPIVLEATTHMLDWYSTSGGQMIPTFGNWITKRFSASYWNSSILSCYTTEAFWDQRCLKIFLLSYHVFLGSRFWEDLQENSLRKLGLGGWRDSTIYQLSC